MPLQKNPPFLGTALGLIASFALLPPHTAKAQTLIQPGVMQYGDADLLGFGYPSGTDPVAGATLRGLTADSITVAHDSFRHDFDFAPGPGDYPGTDQIYVGSTQTDAHDGYATESQRINGPQTVTMDYSSLIGPGDTLTSLTLGIAADDFQFPEYGQPFTATINGVVNTALTTQLNSFDQSGPVEQFFSIGIALSSLNPGHTLTISIDNGGDGGDGWAVDFFTIGVVTAPEPGTFPLLTLGGLAAAGVFVRRRRSLARG